MFRLARIDLAGFKDLLTQWEPHFDGDSGLLYDHCRPFLDHAERICGEKPQDPTYGIWALINENGGKKTYEGFTHINHKLPRTPHAEVRLVWNALHPRYENEFEPETLAQFTVSYIVGAIKLAKGDLLAQSVRIYLGNATDKSYAQGIVASMKSEMNGTSPIEFAGNWLHIVDVTKIDVS
ncbi:hypothetical protein [Rhizobium leguminosarum]|uniref:hypothetical protein n=1 Tax=Rhizobium leguminosarum TaxID=384 RepID=UPI0013BD0944|nr:hypothetical protein [Rhizobium leguminosarum]NEI61397.1 hypothetical protein [Rhizobium leguminosarum]